MRFSRELRNDVLAGDITLSVRRWPRPTFMWRVVAVVGCAAVAVLATGLGAVASARFRPRIATPGRPLLTGAIHLDSRTVVSGRLVRGELVFENHTRTTQVLIRGCRIDGLYAVALRAPDGYVQPPAFSSVACAPEQTLVARPGRTVDRFTVPAIESHCLQSARHQPPRRSRHWAPLCRRAPDGRRDVAPPLPAGRYTALFFADGVWRGPRVRPAVLRVTTAPSHRVSLTASHRGRGAAAGQMVGSRRA